MSPLEYSLKIREVDREKEGNPPSYSVLEILTEAIKV
jgi:hypothetical protein